MEPHSAASASRAGPSGATIARHYDSLDHYYRDLWGEHVHHGLWSTGRETAVVAADNMSRRVLAALQLQEAECVADIGCGYGSTARMAAENSGIHVIGLTLSAAQKSYADRGVTSRGSVAVFQEDWRIHHFADNSLDALFALESLEHMADKAEFARMACRAVRPGGRVVVTTWLAADVVTAWQRRHLLDAICREGRLAPLVTFERLRAMFSQAGLVELEVSDLSTQVSATWTVVLRRLAWRLATRPAYWRFLFGIDSQDAIFALTAARIRLAYRRGCFRYGFLVWQKPAAGS